MLDSHSGICTGLKSSFDMSALTIRDLRLVRQQDHSSCADVYKVACLTKSSLKYCISAILRATWGVSRGEAFV